MGRRDSGNTTTTIVKDGATGADGKNAEADVKDPSIIHIYEPTKLGMIWTYIVPLKDGRGRKNSEVIKDGANGGEGKNDEADVKDNGNGTHTVTIKDGNGNTNTTII
ncbi:collagen-flanked surface repeat-containing protein, partial [Neisseria sp. P0021.S005]|uniref:collagen-flanked surface repeat-containing protein n=1 Tax=Neisseria sp. P0021.S005 TaxID=3436820 RepID=UPI003F7E9C5D